MFFQDKNFEAQLHRTVGYCSAGGAEIGECAETASRIPDGDKERWFQEWSHTAEMVSGFGQECEDAGDFKGASDAYLRASNYFRNAAFVLEDTADDQRAFSAWKKSVEMFEEASKHFSHPAEKIMIPFEKTDLPGYFFRPDQKKAPRATILITNGNDGTLEELYFTAVPALRRGYNVLAFDGPGQGAVLREQKLYFRPDWENVVKPVVNAALSQEEVDESKLILFGRSLGGYLAARAASGEERLCASVVDPGIFDLYEIFYETLPTFIRKAFDEKDIGKINSFFEEQFEKNPALKSKIFLRMWRYGASTPGEMMIKLAAYTLKETIYDIRCPMLVLDNEQEKLSFGQAKRLFDQLRCPKTYHLFTGRTGAGGHCEPLALQQFSEVVFSWLAKNRFLP